MNPSTSDPESLTIRSHAVAELAINTFGGFFPSAEFLDGYTGRTSSNPTERLESIAQERQQLLRRHAKQKEALLEQQSKELHRARAFFNGAADPENFAYEGNPKQTPKPVHDARALAPANARNEVNLLLASQGRLLAKVVEVQRQDLTRLKNLKENTQAEISSTENSLRSGSRFPASEWEFDLLINQVNPQHGTQVAQYLSTDDEAARKVIFSLAHQSGRQWTEAATMPLRTLYSQSAEFRAKVLDTLKPKDSATTHGHRTTVTSLMIP